MIRTAIVGFGFSAKTFHIPFLTASDQYCFHSCVTSRAEHVRLDHPHVAVVNQIDDLPWSELDLVVITTPNHLHFQHAKTVLEQGVSVLIEKPATTSVAHAIQLNALAELKGVSVSVYQNRRWDGDFLTLLSLIENHRLGDIKRMTARWDRFRPFVRERWREQAGDGAGILWDLGPHMIDQTLQLFGRPSEIYAFCSASRASSEADDMFELQLIYSDKFVTLASSCFQAGPTFRFNVEGTEGSFLKEGLDVQEDALKLGVDVNDLRWGQEPETNWGILYGPESNQLIATKPGNYMAFWHQLAKHLTDGTVNPVPLSEVIDVIELIELAQQSAAQGRRVSVPIAVL